ncbi:hypothetical protein L3X38_010596 [Prunus dulcis]|uniref:Uncharacterized protein n=1 Tax=Prunus dulcis TaxID=3755 RepID=A0AAD4WFY0_PRUDU|nr:hypothetical protein L3X38_010596 [Prunus dulcis]
MPGFLQVAPENMFFWGKKLATCLELAIQSVMNLRSKAPVRKLVEVATGMIDGEMDAISYCSLFSKFLVGKCKKWSILIGRRDNDMS